MKRLEVREELSFAIPTLCNNYHIIIILIFLIFRKKQDLSEIKKNNLCHHITKSSNKFL